MLRWDYKLRLYYQFNEPGRAYVLIWRPIYGLFAALVSKRARAEVTLYLEIAGIITAVSILMRLFSGQLFGGFEWDTVATFGINWSLGVVASFLTVYALASPVGGTLMKHVLLRRPNWVRWSLSLLFFWFLYKGLL